MARGRDPSLPLALPPPGGIKYPGVYLLHFSQPIGDPERPWAVARHYLGFTDRTVSRRLWLHRRGFSRVAITTAAKRQGISFRLARIWPFASRQFERRVKNGGGMTVVCPICSGNVAYDRYPAPRQSETIPDLPF